MKQNSVKELDEYYSKKTLEESEKELKQFIEWYNKVYGYHPIIIGGWAVWAYTKHHKSRDIDVVLPTTKTVHELLLPYYKTRKFKSKGMFTKEYFKEVKTKEGIDTIYLDACSYANKNILKKEKIEIPWSLLEKNSKEWVFENKTARIPTPELLLIYKTKALSDRKFEHTQLTPTDKRSAWLKSKIKKDKIDIKALLEKTEINKDKLNELLKKTKFTKYFNETMKESDLIDLNFFKKKFKVLKTRGF
ncbi:MAG: hypothetical protein ABIA76_00195 [Candidatus Diapherotrites archaeon]